MAIIETVEVFEDESGDRGDASASGVSWSAVLAGAVVAAAVYVLLLTLGSALGFTAVSPWSGSGVSAATFGVSAAVWLIVAQWIASGLGGYLTGRLRIKWVAVHSHEVFFRDTAHGLLTWAVATVIAAVLLASAVSSLLSGGTQAAATVLAGVGHGAAQGAQSGAGGEPLAYFTDALFRAPAPMASAGAGNASPIDVHAEAGRILLKGLGDGEISADDKTYLAELVARQTGLSADAAAKRVDDVVAQAKSVEDKIKQAADSARKAAAAFSFYTFFSLLIGAFIASASAALGGRERDGF